MNYIKLINQFWQLRRSKRITNLQADVYYFILQECNTRNWENPFQCSNGLICTSIGITEKSLIDARLRLQQLGLIDFEKGITKQKAPTYYLLNSSNTVSNPVSNPVSNRGGNEVSNPVNIYNKPNENQTKQNNSDAHASATKNRNNLKKEKKSVLPGAKTEYWQKLVGVWFEFYKGKFIIEPTFKGREAQSLKSITDRLKKLSESKQFEWTEEYAVKCITHFLNKSWEDTWRQQNFMLHILSSHFDAIVNSNGQQTNSNSKAGAKSGNNEAHKRDLADRMAKFASQSNTDTV